MGQSCGAVKPLPPDVWRQIISVHCDVYPAIFVCKMLHAIAMSTPLTIKTRKYPALTNQQAARLNIIDLDLHYHSKITTIDPLTSLRRLVLRHVAVASLGTLTRLEKLSLFYADILDDSLYSLTTLQSIDISGVVKIDTGKLTSLVNLRAMYWGTKDFAPFLVPLTQLSTLHFGIFASAPMLQSLCIQHLNISYNKNFRNGHIAGMQLVSLKISGSYITSTAVRGMTTLTNLGASMCQIHTDDLPVSLTWLNIAMCNGDLRGVPALTQLTFLNASGTNITVDDIRKMTSLRRAIIGSFEDVQLG